MKLEYSIYDTSLNENELKGATHVEEFKDELRDGRGILTFLKWYNSDRPHSSLYRMTPDEKFFKTLPALKAA